MRKNWIKAKAVRHGMYGTPTYQSWMDMLRRCYDPDRKDYKRYGGRGIRTPRSWRKFVNFLRDMGVRPAGTTLDRIDVNRSYSIENCRWSTYSEQNRNKRNNDRITFRGKTQCCRAWEEQLGFKNGFLHDRIRRRGMPIEKAFTKPIRKKVS